MTPFLVVMEGGWGKKETISTAAFCQKVKVAGSWVSRAIYIHKIYAKTLAIPSNATVAAFLICSC